MVVRSPCIPPVSTVPHGGQIIVHSTSQHSTTWWSDHRAFHQSTQYYMVVRSPCIPPVTTVPHGGQITVHSTSDHSTTWWSDQRFVRKGGARRPTPNTPLFLESLTISNFLPSILLCNCGFWTRPKPTFNRKLKDKFCKPSSSVLSTSYTSSLYYTHVFLSWARLLCR